MLVTKKHFDASIQELREDMYREFNFIQNTFTDIKKEVKRSADKAQVIMELLSKIESYINGVGVKKADLVKYKNDARYHSEVRKIKADAKRQADEKILNIFDYKNEELKLSTKNTLFIIKFYADRFLTNGGITSADIVNIYKEIGCKEDSRKISKGVCTHLGLLSARGHIIRNCNKKYRRKYKAA